MHVFNSQRPSSNDSSKCFGMSAADSQELNENTQTQTHTQIHKFRLANIPSAIVRRYTKYTYHDVLYEFAASNSKIM